LEAGSEDIPVVVCGSVVEFWPGHSLEFAWRREAPAKKSRRAF
jgi:hypothetical protein